MKNNFMKKIVALAIATAMSVATATTAFAAVTTPTDGTSTPVASVGTELVDKAKGAEVEVIDSTKAEVKYEGATDQTATKVTIPSKVVVNGTEYKVTEVATGAFKGNDELKTVTISKNITTIGANVFKGCTNLKKITITSTKLKAANVDAKAFAGVKKGTTIVVPAKKLSAYKKLFAKCGLKKTVKVVAAK